MLETSVLIGLVVPGDTIVLVAVHRRRRRRRVPRADVRRHRRRADRREHRLRARPVVRPAHPPLAAGAGIGEENWARAQRYLDRRGGPAVFISRFLPVLHSARSAHRGHEHDALPEVHGWTVPACVIWAFAYVTVGWLAAGSYRELSRELHWAGYLFVGRHRGVPARRVGREEADPPRRGVGTWERRAAGRGARPARRSARWPVGADDEGPDAEASDPSTATGTARRAPSRRASRSRSGRPTPGRRRSGR